jgi:hypothetical protein
MSMPFGEVRRRGRKGERDEQGRRRGEDWKRDGGGEYGKKDRSMGGREDRRTGGREDGRTGGREDKRMGGRDRRMERKGGTYQNCRHQLSRHKVFRSKLRGLWFSTWKASPLGPNTKIGQVRNPQFCNLPKISELIRICGE